MYCTECYRADGKGTESGPYIFNGNSLCNTHFWEAVKADEAMPNPVTTPKRGTRLPAEWVPSAESVTKMMAELQVPKVFLVSEHRKFCDYWYAVSGQKGVKLDWDRTWCNWMRKAAEGKGGGVLNSTDQKVSGYLDRAERLAAEVVAEDA